jgi:hypothetical protein
MEKYRWSKLNHLQLGRYAEYYVKMEFIGAGIDVFTTEVDDKGIDFVIKNNENQYCDIQVKSSRNLSYIFFQKSKFQLRPKLFAAIAIFIDDKLPDIYLIPSETWQNPSDIFKSRDYEGKASESEWGLNLSEKNYKELEPYRFENMVESLFKK